MKEVLITRVCHACVHHVRYRLKTTNPKAVERRLDPANPGGPVICEDGTNPARFEFYELWDDQYKQ